MVNQVTQCLSTVPNALMDTHPRTRTSQEPANHRQERILEMKEFLNDAQAACGFSCPASKRTPFFHTSKVIAAILRASVRRAIGGFIPLAMSAS
jgi:hypothetical protein